MTIASFAPTATIELSVTATSANVALPTTGTPTVVLVSNVSSQIISVALGNASVTATIGTSLVVMPMTQLALTIGANTYIAAVCETAGAIIISVGN